AGGVQESGQGGVGVPGRPGDLEGELVPDNGDEPDAVQGQRLVGGRGRPARAGSRAAPRSRRTAGPRPRGRGSRPARHHHLGPAAPTREGRDLRMSTIVQQAARHAAPSLAELAFFTGRWFSSATLSPAAMTMSTPTSARSTLARHGSRWTRNWPTVGAAGSTRVSSAAGSATRAGQAGLDLGEVVQDGGLRAGAPYQPRGVAAQLAVQADR